MFYFTGIQHKKTEDIAISAVGYATRDGYKAAYHHEMDYAMSNQDFLGLTILVFDNSGAIVLSDNWVREVQEQPAPVEE